VDIVALLIMNPKTAKLIEPTKSSSTSHRHPPLFHVAMNGMVFRDRRYHGIGTAL
jgi:hypothetical protein